jgi:hypothetical protein
VVWPGGIAVVALHPAEGRLATLAGDALAGVALTDDVAGEDDDVAEVGLAPFACELPELELPHAAKASIVNPAMGRRTGIRIGIVSKQAAKVEGGRTLPC